MTLHRHEVCKMSATTLKEPTTVCKPTRIIHMLHDPVHSCLNAGVIAEMYTLDAGVTREVHVHKLTNDRLVYVNSYLPSISQSIQT